MCKFFINYFQGKQKESVQIAAILSVLFPLGLMGYYIYQKKGDAAAVAFEWFIGAMLSATMGIILGEMRKGEFRQPLIVNQHMSTLGV